jgi:hypothetical protein
MSPRFHSSSERSYSIRILPWLTAHWPPPIETWGKAELARQNAIEAFDLKDRVTDFEKLSLEAWYYLYVTGDLEKAAEAFEIERRTFPVSSRSLNDLGGLFTAVSVVSIKKSKSTAILCEMAPLLRQPTAILPSA